MQPLRTSAVRVYRRLAPRVVRRRLRDAWYAYTHGCNNSDGSRYTCGQTTWWLADKWFRDCRTMHLSCPYDPSRPGVVGRLEPDHQVLLLCDRWLVDFWFRDVWHARMPLALDLQTRRGRCAVDRCYGRDVLHEQFVDALIARAKLPNMLAAFTSQIR